MQRRALLPLINGPRIPLEPYTLEPLALVRSQGLGLRLLLVRGGFGFRQCGGCGFGAQG